jgi:hypothetical protein
MATIASYPGSVKNFGTDRVNFTDVIFAEHVNTLRAEVVAIESALGTNINTGTNGIGVFDPVTTAWPSLQSRITNIEYGLRDALDVTVDTVSPFLTAGC